jgi:hypothetical protein
MNKTPLESALHHHNTLESLIQADLALAYAPALSIDEPHQLSDITREWLEATLSKGVQEAVLEEIQVNDEHSGMTSRRKWQLVWNEAGKAADLPAMVFVKATPDIPFHRETLAVLHMHELEANFYTQIQPDFPELAPKAFYAKSYAGGRFLILLEDLELKGCQPFWIKDTVEVSHLHAVARTLAQFHAHFWESPRLQTDLSWVRPRTCRVGNPWLARTMADVRQVFPTKAEELGVTDLILPPPVMQTLLRWTEHADRIFDWFDTLPRTVLHGDSHLGNTFAQPDGTAGLFDWQLMFSGHGLRDLVYFMYSAMDNEMRKAHEQAIFETYLSVLADNGVTLDRDDAWNLYCLFLLDHWDASSSTVVHGSYNHATEALLRGLTAIAGSIIDNDIGSRLEQLIKNELS